MKITELEIGTKLELEPYNEDGISLDKYLVSEFEWVIDDKYIMIAAPIKEGVIYPLHLGVVMNVYFIKKVEEEFQLYTFKAQVIGRETVERIAMLKVEFKGEIERVQRRRFYRLGCSLPVKYRIVETMNEAFNTEIRYKNTIACNLSGGGLCLLLEEKIEYGKLIECEISTDESKKVTLMGRVIRNEHCDLESRFKYTAGISYVKINDSDREAVVKFIFREQIKLRKKGLI